MTINFNDKLIKFLLSIIQHYNHERYWKRRGYIINPKKKNLLKKLYFLYWIKKVDAYHNCSFGTNYNSGANFQSPPLLPHGPKNIIIGHDLQIGDNVTIYHGVTLCHGGSIIGNNVLFSTGSVLLPGKNIGNNVKIGANTVITDNIPDNATVVTGKPTVFLGT